MAGARPHDASSISFAARSTRADVDARETVGHMAETACRRLAHEVAGAAVNVDTHDSGAWRQRRVARRQGRPENREHRRADRGGQMHRSGIAGDEQRHSFEDRREHNQIDLGRQLDERNVGRPCGSNSVQHGLVGGRADEHDRCVAGARNFGTDLRKPDGIPFLDLASGRRLDADQRRAVSEWRRARRPCGGVVGDVQLGRAAALRYRECAVAPNARATNAFALSAM